MPLKDLAICPEPGAIEAIQKAFDQSADYRLAGHFNPEVFYRRLIEQGYDVMADPPRSGKGWRMVEEKLVESLKIIRNM